MKFITGIYSQDFSVSTDSFVMVKAEKNMNRAAKFNIGDLVLHLHQGYRAIVVDVDPSFQASGHYNPQACKRDFTQRNPWYRLLVDGRTLVTYVEEPLLALDPNQAPIDNPKVDDYLVVHQGHYCSNASRH